MKVLELVKTKMHEKHEPVLRLLGRFSVNLSGVPSLLIAFHDVPFRVTAVGVIAVHDYR